jgi:alkylation response protein AidB-like acyl-CoA dehydrogenase
MNFELTEEQKLFADSVRRFALAKLEKNALKRAHTSRYPFDVAQLMAEQGLMGITIPAADGGLGGTLMDAVIAIEQVAAVCPRSADVVQFGNFGPIRAFAEHGTDERQAGRFALHHQRQQSIFHLQPRCRDFPDLCPLRAGPRRDRFSHCRARYARL